MRKTINRLHDRVSVIISRLLYENQIRRALAEKQINPRQYTIFAQLLDKDRPLPLEEIRQSPWYQSLYLKRHDKTRQRDLQNLRELEWVYLDANNYLWPGFIKPQQIKPLGRKKP